jgi:hypothetical protein
VLLAILYPLLPVLYSCIASWKSVEVNAAHPCIRHDSATTEGKRCRNLLVMLGDIEVVACKDISRGCMPDGIQTVARTYFI